MENEKNNISKSKLILALPVNVRGHKRCISITTQVSDSKIVGQEDQNVGNFWGTFGNFSENERNLRSNQKALQKKYFVHFLI
jgi:hypothetical protein